MTVEASLRRFGLIVALLSVTWCAAAQQKASDWVVKPEWVRAHEEFLASDALGGRQSASRAEEITANYVASEFIAYGLKTAPGMLGYIQSADVDFYTTPTGRQRLRLVDAPTKTSRKTFNAIGYLQGSDPAAAPSPYT